MKQHFRYKPFKGTENYAYLGCYYTEEPLAAAISEHLACRGMQFYHAAIGAQNAPDSDELAERIANCRVAVLFLSPKGMENLSFRNTVNYLLSLRKPMICIQTTDFSLSHGLEMQLANIRTIEYSGTEQTAEALLQCGLLTQDIVGDGMETKTDSHRKKCVSGILVAAFVLLFAICIGWTVQKRTSAAYLLQDVNGSDYVNIASFGDKGIAALSGKTVQELDLSGGKFTSLEGLEKVTAATVNVAGISTEVKLWPLLRMSGIETVKLDQTQCVYARELCNAGIRVVIVP